MVSIECLFGITGLETPVVCVEDEEKLKKVEQAELSEEEFHLDVIGPSITSYTSSSFPIMKSVRFRNIRQLADELSRDLLGMIDVPKRRVSVSKIDARF